MSNRIPKTLALLACLVAVPGTAHAADVVANAGYVDGLEINQASADAYLMWHGRMFIAENKQTRTEYRWGGTSCGTRVLSDHQVMVLMHALEGGVKVQPRFQEGQGAARCVVGFTLLP